MKRYTKTKKLEAHILAVIPARSGSKRIPRKNIRDFHGKPIIEYSIEAAKESGLFNNIIVSLDDEEFADIAISNGVEAHWRDPWLCGDLASVGTVAVVREITKYNHLEKAICCIYPCAPFINGDDICESFNLFMSGTTDYLYVTDGRSSTDQGQFYWGLDSTWRVGLPINHTDAMKLAIPDAIDINTQEDWDRAEKLYEERYGTE